MTATEWHEVGVVLVDSGSLVLIDPGNVDDVPEPDKLGELLDRGDGIAAVPGHYVPALGVMITTGYGDGCYPVHVQRTDDGRIRAVRVTFIPHPVHAEGVS